MSFVPTGLTPELNVPPNTALVPFGISIAGLACGPSQGLEGLGCAAAYPDQNVCWRKATSYNPSAQQGRDVLWQDVGLRGLSACVPDYVAPVVTTPTCPAGSHWVPDTGSVYVSGLGDFIRAAFTVPENPIAPGMAGLAGNSLGRSFAGMRGIDFSSMSNFVSSVETGSTAVAGYTLPNWALLAGAVAAVAMVAGHGGRGRR